jgi:hypothetical protein
MKMDVHGPPCKLHLRKSGFSYEDVIWATERTGRSADVVAGTASAKRTALAAPFVDMK